MRGITTKWCKMTTETCKLQRDTKHICKLFVYYSQRKKPKCSPLTPFSFWSPISTFTSFSKLLRCTPWMYLTMPQTAYWAISRSTDYINMISSPKFQSVLIVGCTNPNMKRHLLGMSLKKILQLCLWILEARGPWWRWLIYTLLKKKSKKIKGTLLNLSIALREINLWDINLVS